MVRSSKVFPIPQSTGIGSLNSTLRSPARLLPVTARFLARAPKSQRSRPEVSVLVIQHLLADTAHFVTLLRAAGFEVYRVIGVEYSSKPTVLQRLVKGGFDAVVPRFPDLPATIRKALREFRGSSSGVARQLVIHEVGGYCADIVRLAPGLIPETCVGVVEETKQGLWRYHKVRALGYPVLHIADSRLKNVEASYIGQAVARSLLEDIESVRVRREGCTVGVLGSGVIGRSIHMSLSRLGLSVASWDKSPTARMAMTERGFAVVKRAPLLKSSDAVIGATGARSISWPDLRDMKDGVILASASSRTIELPVGDIRKYGARGVRQGYVEAYSMPWGKTVNLVHGGFPVNFRRRSLPFPVADLMFAQIAVCIGKLVKSEYAPSVHGLSKKDEVMIARAWVEQYGHQKHLARTTAEVRKVAANGGGWT